MWSSLVGKLATRQQLIWLENLLAESNIFSFCRDIESDIVRFNYTGDPEQLIGEPCIAAVVASWEDAGRMQKILRQHSEQVFNMFGSDVTITHQFWPYFLNYLELSRISFDVPDRFFLSTQIINQDDLIVELPYRHFEFDLKITTIKASATLEEINSIRQEIASLLSDLNLRSRYLKIGAVATGYAQSKFIFSGQQEPTYLPLELD